MTTTRERVERALAKNLYFVPFDHLTVASRERLSELADAAIRVMSEEVEARGIHTCHDHCQRTECVLRRERDALVEGVRELVAEAYDPCAVLVETPRPEDRYVHASDLTALLARVVEGKRP